MAVRAVRPSATLYERDWHAWLERQEELVRAGRLTELDLPNIAEELRDMGASERRELQSQLVTLLMRLLTYQFQPAMRSGSWRGTIADQRIRIDDALRISPSLAAFLREAHADPRTYVNAVRRASLETELGADAFPAQCPYRLEEILDPDFWPGAGPHPARAAS